MSLLLRWDRVLLFPVMQRYLMTQRVLLGWLLS